MANNNTNATNGESTYEDMIAALNNVPKSNSNSQSQDLQQNNTSTHGALLRGLLNGITMGTADDIASIPHAVFPNKVNDWGAELRHDEVTDEQQHPYANVVGNIIGAVAPNLIPAAGEANDTRVGIKTLNALRSIIDNPITRNTISNGAISAVGNSNDLADGNVTGAAGQAALGGVEGGTIGKALNMLGNKFATGSFGKIAPRDQSLEYTDGGNISDVLRNNNVPTPNQYSNAIDGNKFQRFYANRTQNLTSNTPQGQQVTRELLNHVNNTFPNAVEETMVRVPEGDVTDFMDAFNDYHGASYNANTLKNAFDERINDLNKETAEARNNNPYYGATVGMVNNKEISNLQNSNAYKLAQAAAPIHGAIENNIKEDIASPNLNDAVKSYGPSAIGGLLLDLLGHGTLGGAGLGTSAGKFVERKVTPEIGINDIRDALANPRGQAPVISNARVAIGNNIQSPSITNGINNVLSTGQNAPEPRQPSVRDILKAKGLSEEQIDNLINQ